MKVNMPQFLSKPMAFLFLESDELVIALCSFAFAMIIGGIIPIAIAVILFMTYRRFRKEAGRGFINHLPYMLGVKTFNGFPHAYVDKFEE